MSLEAYAALSAAVAEGDRTLDEVLRAAGVDPRAWRAAQVEWNHAIALDEMTDGAAGLATQFGDLFARAQDALKPVPELAPEQWAAISDDVVRHGTDVLARHGLTAPD